MINDIFYKNLDYIDLHGYDMDSARVATEDFIYESVCLGREKIVIIHGIGGGFVRKSVHDFLEKSKDVKSFKIDNNNAGMTIVELKLDKH